MRTIIRNATIVNEGKIYISDVLLSGAKIEKIEKQISLPNQLKYEEINADGLHLIPGMIDDQVHFREPGFARKGTIHSESRAAVAGGITSFMEMPNTFPNTLTQELLEEKFTIAKNSSWANYSFFMGVNKNNLEEALKTDVENVCGISDDGLYFNSDEGILANYPDFLEELFSKSETLIALHCEDDKIIKRNLNQYKEIFGNEIPAKYHPLIRSEEACVQATKRVLEIAKKHNTRMHFLHISTAAEGALFDNDLPAGQKRITAEACIHHLWFSEKDYDNLGSRIKWNPAIKSENDKEGLIKLLNDNRLDIIATDHAPHTVDEKSGNYFESLSGGPLVQHALPAMLELFHQGKISLEKIVEKTSHHVAEIYRMNNRGYIREGYYADLVLVDLRQNWKVSSENILYKCNWSPFEGYEFKSKITHTFVNGNLVYDHGDFNEIANGKRLKFSKNR
jgi:dihydroorotase